MVNLVLDANQIGFKYNFVHQGPYGIRLLNETLMWHVGSQVQELRRIVIQNKDALVALRTNFDKPEIMKELSKRLTMVDNVLQASIFQSRSFLLIICFNAHLSLFQRMTIVGVILSFRELLREALNAQLEERIPFLHSTIKDFHDHASLPEQSTLVR